MTITATLSPIQQAAQLCYRMVISPLDQTLISDDGLKAIQDIVGSPISAEEIIHLGSKLRQGNNFDAMREQILDKWQDRMDSRQSLNEKNSLAFILELFSELDHAVLFDHDITANHSSYQRGMVRDSELKFPGSMPCWTLHLTTRGKALFLNENMEVEVGRGDMMLFQPDACYHYAIHPSTDNWEHLWVLFQPRAHWREWLEWAVVDDGIMHLSLPDSESFALIEDLFRQLVALKDESSPIRSDLQHNRLEEILVRASAQAHRIPADKRIDCACEYMLAHLNTKFSVDDIAASCSLSTSRLAHLFKQHMGVSIKSWSNNMRLQQARKLLLRGNDSIGLIARQVGYEDPTQFTRYFKKNMGCSPREFRHAFTDNGAV